MRPLVYTIDDDLDFNMILKTTLSKCDIEVITHSSAEDFTKSVKARIPNLCILDLNLDSSAGGEGFHLLRAMRNVLGPDLPLLVMSKRGNHDDVKKVMELGANDFVPKPLDDQYLLQKLKEYFPTSLKLKMLQSNLSSISAADQDALISIPFTIKSASINGIELESKVQVPKGITLELISGSLEKIYGNSAIKFVVVDSSTKEGCFGASAEPELSEKEYLHLRRWLIDGK